MTGIEIDIFTAILMVILAFICGYSGGHKYGREEVRKSITDISQNIVRMIDGQHKKSNVPEDKFDGRWTLKDNLEKERDKHNE